MFGRVEGAKYCFKHRKRKKRIVEEFRNPLGIPGGKFTKREMCLAIIDNNEVSDDWSKYIKSIKKEIMEGKNIPKPHEDINDAWFLYHILKNKYS